METYHATPTMHVTVTSIEQGVTLMPFPLFSKTSQRRRRAEPIHHDATFTKQLQSSNRVEAGVRARAVGLLRLD
eukprot:scaffold18079_cov38-Tisochrysis_lutea.AAC.2